MISEEEIDKFIGVFNGRNLDRDLVRDCLMVRKLYDSNFERVRATKTESGTDIERSKVRLLRTRLLKIEDHLNSISKVLRDIGGFRAQITEGLKYEKMGTR